VCCSDCRRRRVGIRSTEKRRETDRTGVVASNQDKCVKEYEEIARNLLGSTLSALTIKRRSDLREFALPPMSTPAHTQQSFNTKQKVANPSGAGRR
jgi:hypothetical protein